MKPTAMPTRFLLGLLTLIATPLALGACDDGADEHEHEHDHDHDHDDHGDHGDAPELDTYEAGGITKATDDGHFMVTLVADPEPPAKGFNTWRLMVMSHEDMELVEEADVIIEPWMPEHEHGSDSEAVVEEKGSGEYTSSTVELQMLGVWDTTVTISHGDTTDEVHFVFEVE